MRSNHNVRGFFFDLPLVALIMASLRKILRIGEEERRELTSPLGPEKP